jgi:hypothetical protein
MSWYLFTTIVFVCRNYDPIHNSLLYTYKLDIVNYYESTAKSLRT